MTGCRFPHMFWGAAGDWSLGISRRLGGRHGTQARQPQATANTAAMPQQVGYGRILARRRVSCGPNVATYVGPRLAHTPTPRHMPVVGDKIFGDPAAHHRPGACPRIPCML